MICFAGLLRTVNLGDDADTTGAVCGQLAGACWGESGIPGDWLEGLARRDAQAKRLLGAGKSALIILGGAHDLSDNLDRLSGGKAEYIRVATKQWQEFAGDVGRGEPNKPR